MADADGVSQEGGPGTFCLSGGLMSEMDTVNSEGLVVLISFPGAAEAIAAGRTLVTEHLAACVHVLPGITAIYRWKGTVEEDAQTLLICKTTHIAWTKLLERARALHSDEVPEIIALPIVEGLPEYMSWMRDIVQG